MAKIYSYKKKNGDEVTGGYDYEDGYIPELPSGYTYDPITKEVTQSAASIKAQENPLTLEQATAQKDVQNIPAATQTTQSYTSPYAQSMSQLTQQYLNPTPFSYDYETDPLYQQYLASYTKQGQNAMADTLAQVSARTGGLASSYAASAAQGAYNNYLQKANEKIPELYQMRYNEWNDQQNRLLNQYNLLANADATAYSRYRDSLSDQLNAENTAYNRNYQESRDKISDDRYADELAYNRGRDTISDQRYAEETAYNRGQDQKNWDYKYAQLNQENALNKANYLASLGDYSGIAKYYGITENQAAGVPETYSEYVKATGDSGIMTEREFQVRKNSGSNELSTYKDYASYLRGKYKEYQGSQVVAEQNTSYVNEIKKVYIDSDTPNKAVKMAIAYSGNDADKAYELAAQAGIPESEVTAVLKELYPDADWGK